MFPNKKLATRDEYAIEARKTAPDILEWQIDNGYRLYMSIIEGNILDINHALASISINNTLFKEGSFN
jgi:hypothetical protein